MIGPILLLAVAASVLSFVIDNSVDPYARQRGRELVASARADLLSLVIQEGSFRKVEDGLYVQIAERLPNGRLRGIFIADARTDGIELVYYAKNGLVVERDGKNLLAMEDGEVQRKTSNGEVSIIRFTSNAFDLSSFQSSGNTVRLLPKDQTLGYLFNPDPNDRFFQSTPLAFSAEIHRRLTEWLYPLVFAMIALAVASTPRSARENRIHPLITATVIALFVRWLGFFFADQVQRSLVFAPVVYLVPLGAMLLCAVFLAADRSMELPTSLVERIGSRLRRWIDRLMLLRWGGREGAAGTA